MRKSELVPVVPPEEHPYMHNLYARNSLALDSTADDVLAVAHLKWEAAADISDRTETAELLLGRRIDGQELNVLPAAFKQHVFEAGHFDGLLSITSQIAEVERS